MASIKHFRAVTRTGTTYTYTGGAVLLHDPSGLLIESIRPIRFSTLNYQNIRDAYLDLGSDAAWTAVFATERASAPVVGLSIYVADNDSWRISSPVVSVELLP